MNKFQEIRNNEKDIFNIKIKFWYFIKYYIKNFLLNTIVKTNLWLSNFTISILTKEEFNKINDILVNWCIGEYSLFNWDWYTLDDEYSLYLFYEEYSLSDFNDNKDFYLKFFEKVRFLFSQKNLVWEKQILLKIFWYNSIFTCFKMIFNHIHLIWLWSYKEYEHYMKLITKQYDEINKLLRHYIDMNDENFENEMKMLYDIFYWFDITKLYYSLFFDVDIKLMKARSFDLFKIYLFDLPHQDIESTLKEYIFKDKWLEFFFLSFYLYFEKIQKFNEKYWIKFRKLWNEKEKIDFHSFCQVVDKHIKIWLNEYSKEQQMKIINNEIVK